MNMLSHEEMVVLHAEEHSLVDTSNFRSKEKYVLHLLHTFAYLQASRLAKNKTVLDLGCNNGYGSAILSTSAKKVCGVDVSEKAVSAAKMRFGSFPVDFKLTKGNRLPFKDDKFDMVVSFQVIEHIVDYDIYINEIKRVLLPGGTVLFTTPNSLIRLYPGMKPWNKFHVREFEHSEFDGFLKQFFQAVRVLGLFAEEPLYSIEINRVDKIRKKIRTNGVDSANLSLRRSFKRNISSIFSAIKTKYQNNSIENEKSEAVKDAELKGFLNEYGIKDFFFCAKDLDIALDLLAACSVDDRSLEEIYAKIQKRETFR